MLCVKLRDKLNVREVFVKLCIIMIYSDDEPEDRTGVVEPPHENVTECTKGQQERKPGNAAKTIHRIHISINTKW